MRDETKKKAREAHYPAPFRLIDLFETPRRRPKRAQDGRDALLRAAPGLRAVAQPAPRVQALGALEGQAPKDIKWKPLRVHVIGAGTMGADIAGWCVASGMEVTLQDVSAEQIEKGIKAQGKLLRAEVQDQGSAQRRQGPSHRRSERLRHAARADVIIEAIVERLDIKQKLFKELEGKIKPGAVLATNTSSLEIEEIAKPAAPIRGASSAFTSSTPWRRCRSSRWCAAQRATTRT